MLAFKKFVIPGAVAASLVVSACGGSSPKSTSHRGSGALLRTGAVSGVSGAVLVDAQGLTLYRLSGEQAGRFICTSACLQTWHPLRVSAGSRPTGAVGSLGVVKRPDGSSQVTYKGMPLYTFVQDTAPGQANGQGIKDVGTWNAVTAAAATGGHAAAGAPATQATPAPPATPAGGGYGY